MSITVSALSKRFGPHQILDGVDLEVEAGKLVALLGPSGSGKTTLLRLIGGLETPDTGRILLDGEDVTHSAPGSRGVGFVFQHYALFRHMTVFENVAFGLRVKPRASRPPESELRDRVHRLLDLVQLAPLAGRNPAQLSGGQRQRVALARALAVEPRVLLLDEPFGALDARVRRDLRGWLRRLQESLKFTSLFVTHDQDEALELADKVVIINGGRVEQTGTPREVYEHPSSRFVCSFLGSVNLFRGRLSRGRATIQGVEFEAPEHASVSDSAVVAYVRPHELGITRTRGVRSFLDSLLVRHVLHLGPVARLVLGRDDGDDLEADLPLDVFQSLGVSKGERVFVEPRQTRFFLDSGLESAPSIA